MFSSCSAYSFFFHLALLIACKYEEMTIPGMNDFVYVSDNAYSKEDMKDMERRMISALSYDLGRPLSINFLRRYSKIVQATDIEHTLGKYLLDLTFTDHSLCHVSPSYLAACASFLSRYLFSYRRLTATTSISLLIEHLWPNKFMSYHTNYTYEQLRQGIEQLGQLLIGQDTTKLKSVQKKFSQSQMFSVAQHSCCKSAYVQLALTHLSKSTVI
jgi:G2/mitotic-specific cyclin-B2